jgi:hypothetical protein
MFVRCLATSLALGFLTAACDDDASGVRCGPGTMLAGDTCVPAVVDAGSRDAASAGDGGRVDDDGALDAGTDGGEPDRCRGSDRSICEGSEVVDCATSRRQPCTEPEACHVLTRGDGAREGFCAPAGVVPCDPEVVADRCDGAVLRRCFRRLDTEGRVLPGWELARNCADAGPGASCQTSPSPHCEFTPCDRATTPTSCDATGRVRGCGVEGLIWWECGAGFECRPDRTRANVVCVPPGAVASTRGSSNPESVACVGASVRLQRGGYEWVAPCEDTLVRIDGDFLSAPTSCVTREGLAYCMPDARYRMGGCTGTGWSCDGDYAVYCDGGVTEKFGCVVGCDPETSRCIAPVACDPDAMEGECIDPTLGAACRDDDGDGSGFINTIPCVGGCIETGGFSCR